MILFAAILFVFRLTGCTYGYAIYAHLCSCFTVPCFLRSLDSKNRETGLFFLESVKRISCVCNCIIYMHLDYLFIVLYHNLQVLLSIKELDVYFPYAFL